MGGMLSILTAYQLYLCILQFTLCVIIVAIGTSSHGNISSLIELLTHCCQQMLVPGEVVKNMAVTDFYTAVVTNCDRVYWW